MTGAHHGLPNSQVQHRFNVGDKVEALDPHTREWRPAHITRIAPYRGRPGYDVSYADATEQWHCAGGWQSEGNIRCVALCDCGHALAAHRWGDCPDCSCCSPRASAAKGEP